MNRSDLSWALSSVIPHAGRQPATAFVGLAFNHDATYAYASDGYTIGIARVPGWAEGSAGEVHLSPKEATELMRFVRPGKVAEHEQKLFFAAREVELHVGFDGDAEVFDSAAASLTLTHLLQRVQLIDRCEVELHECVYQPKLFERFAKAQRVEGDRLRMFPRRGRSGKYGAAVVTVGTDFIGAIAGLEYDDQGPATVAEFLSFHERTAA